MRHFARIKPLNSYLFGSRIFRFSSNQARASEGAPRNPDEPLKYFGSPAEKYRATPALPDQPRYSPHIIIVSLIVFMVYFCILREENDTDELFKRDLFDHWGEEASRLKKAYDYNIKHNLPTSEIVSRLRELGCPVPRGV